jgi:hypothetical protein
MNLLEGLTLIKGLLYTAMEFGIQKLDRPFYFYFFGCFALQHRGCLSSRWILAVMILGRYVVQAQQTWTGV